MTKAKDAARLPKVAALLLAGCSGGTAHPGADLSMGHHPELGAATDLRPSGDLRMPPPDLLGADLRPPPPDLLPPPPDQYVSPTLHPPASCKGNKVTASAVFSVAESFCSSTGMCHIGVSGMAGGLNMGVDGPSFRAAVVGVPAQTALMDLVTPGNGNESYLLFKLTGQQLDVRNGSGAQMPEGSMLPDAQLCVFVDWVVGGAA